MSATATITREDYLAKLAQQMNERGRNGLQQRVMSLALGLKRTSYPGLLYYHTQDSRKCPVGFPDVQIVIPERERVIVAELKRERQRPTVEQAAWLDAYAVADAVEVYLWRPQHLLSGVIHRLLCDVPVSDEPTGRWLEGGVVGDPYSSPRKRGGAP